MTVGKEKPLSEKISEYDGGEYLLTAAIWRTMVGHEVFDTFEIGIRRKKDGEFWLLQSRKWNHQSVQEMANAMAMLLADDMQNYDPDWCREYMAGE